VQRRGTTCVGSYLRLSAVSRHCTRLQVNQDSCKYSLNPFKTLLRDAGLSTIADLDLSQAMASRAVWRDICNVAGVDVDAFTVSKKKKEEEHFGAPAH